MIKAERKRELLRWIKERKLDKDPGVNKDRKQGKVHAVSKTERKIKLLRLVKIEENASEVNK